jgi:ATP-dependent Clp protease ATP-binding subunit ClpX
VIGQEEAKRALSTAVFQQYQKVSTKNTIKNNVLLIGPTGTGKTYLARTLAEYLNVPIVFCSANEFTETGYVGRDVTEIVADLVKKADNNIEKAEKGIVFIDEIDKIATYNSIYAHFNNRDVSGRSVQEELLDLLEGSGKRCFSKNRWFSSNIYFNISKVLFIAAGAFDGLRELIEKRQKPSIGFYSENNNRNDSANTMSIEISDLIEYGLIPELIGRFPVIVQCNPLEKSDLLKILLESEDSVLKKYQKFFKEYGTELEFSNDFLESVVEISLLRKTGARGLASVLENILRPYLFDLTNPAKRKNHIIFENYSFPSVQENKVTIQEETKQ